MLRVLLDVLYFYCKLISSVLEVGSEARVRGESKECVSADDG